MNRTSLSLAVLGLWVVLLPCLTVAVAHCGAVGSCLTVTTGAVLPPVSLLSEVFLLSLVATGAVLFSILALPAHSSTLLRFRQNRILKFSHVPRHLRNEVFLL